MRKVSNKKCIEAIKSFIESNIEDLYCKFVVDFETSPTDEEKYGDDHFLKAFDVEIQPENFVKVYVMDPIEGRKFWYIHLPLITTTDYEIYDTATYNGYVGVKRGSAWTIAIKKK